MRVLLAAEDEGHRVAVMTLTDRLIAERVEWAAELPEYVRTWCSDAGQPYLALKTAYERARADRRERLQREGDYSRTEREKYVGLQELPRVLG